jgi:hypothetical protein
MNNNDFTDLAVLDTVLVGVGEFNYSYARGVVEKITPTQVVVLAKLNFDRAGLERHFWKFGNKGGNMVGDNHIRLLHYDDDLWQKENERQVRNRFGYALARVKWESVSLDAIQKIAAIIEAEKAKRE